MLVDRLRHNRDSCYAGLFFVLYGDLLRISLAVDTNIYKYLIFIKYLVALSVIWDFMSAVTSELKRLFSAGAAVEGSILRLRTISPRCSTLLSSFVFIDNMGKAQYLETTK